MKASYQSDRNWRQVLITSYNCERDWYDDQIISGSTVQRGERRNNVALRSSITLQWRRQKSKSVVDSRKYQLNAHDSLNHAGYPWCVVLTAAVFAGNSLRLTRHNQQNSLINIIPASQYWKKAMSSSFIGLLRSFVSLHSTLRASC